MKKWGVMAKQENWFGSDFDCDILEDFALSLWEARNMDA
jgi:hypothetical protein